jgi:hypothetical protein
MTKAGVGKRTSVGSRVRSTGRLTIWGRILPAPEESRDTLSCFDGRPVDLFGFVLKARGVELNARRPCRQAERKSSSRPVRLAGYCPGKPRNRWDRQ